MFGKLTRFFSKLGTSFANPSDRRRLRTVLGLTPLEDRTVPTAIPTTGPNGGAWVKIDTLTVSTRNNPTAATGVASNVALNSGTTYLAVASGTARIATDATGFTDAEYIRYNKSSGPQDGSSPGYAWNNHGVRLAGVSGGDTTGNLWGSYQADHQYVKTFTGQGTKVTGYYSDIPGYYGDNSGTLTVDIYAEVPVVTAVDDTVSTHGLDPVQLAVLANDTDSANSSLTVTSWTQPATGNLTFDPVTQTFTYTPGSRLASANDSFTYTVSNGRGGSATATATIDRVFWISPVGGDWSYPVNWNAGLIPNAEDDVTILLPPTETVLVPTGFAAEVHSLNSTARFDVAGGLSLYGKSALSGDFDVEGSVNVAVLDVVPSAAQGDEVSLLPYLETSGGLLLTGGGTISGTLTTQPTSQTTIAAGTVQLVGDGSLTGDGWVSVNGGASTLSFDGSASNVSRLYAGNDSMVAGSADLTVTTLVAQQATFLGESGCTLTVTASAFLGAPLGATTIFNVRNLAAEPDAEFKIAGDLELKGKQTTELSGTTDWTKGNISITGQSRLDNRGQLNISARNKVTGGVRADGTPDGTFENSGTINLELAPGMVLFENIAFLNQAGGRVAAELDPLRAPVLPYGIVFSGGTGIQRGMIDMDEENGMGQAAQVIFAHGTRQIAYTGSEFNTRLVIEDDSTLTVPFGESTKIKKLELSSSIPLTPAVTGGGALEVYGEFDWKSGTVSDVNVLISSQPIAFQQVPAVLNVSQGDIRGASRTLSDGAVKILGTAEVTADWNVVDGGRILVDGTNNTEKLLAGALSVTDASILTDAQSPGLPLWIRNGGTLQLDSVTVIDAKTKNMVPSGSIAVPVVLDDSKLESGSFALQAGLLQRGQSTTTISGKNNLITGKAPMNEGSGPNLRTEPVYIAGGTLSIGSRASLATDGDIIIKQAASLSGKGIIQVGTKQECFVVVQGALRLSPPNTPDDDKFTSTLNILGNLSLDATSTTRIRVVNNLSDYISATKTISLGGKLEVVNENNIQNQTWTIMVAALDRDAPPPIKLTGEFGTVSNGFATIKLPQQGPFDTLNLKTGNG